jgi:hypothetical protein
MERKVRGPGWDDHPGPTTPTPDACLRTVHRCAASPSVHHRQKAYDEKTTEAIDQNNEDDRSNQSDQTSPVGLGAAAARRARPRGRTRCPPGQLCRGDPRGARSAAGARRPEHHAAAPGGALRLGATSHQSGGRAGHRGECEYACDRRRGTSAHPSRFRAVDLSRVSSASRAGDV